MADEDSKPARDGAQKFEQAFSADTVRALACAASLPLSSGRVAAVLPILRIWLADSAALNRLMQDAVHREVLPITVLRHRAADGEGIE